MSSPRLKDKVALVTGGSRGIGAAIAARCARDGANVAIAAKSDVPNPKLPGTIHSAARAVEEAGGREPWVEKSLRDKGLFVDTDPSTLSNDAERNAFKERKRAESAERKRLRKVAWASYRATHVVHVGAGIFYSDTLDEETAERDARVARAKENDLSALDTPDALAKALGVTMIGTASTEAKAAVARAAAVIRQLEAGESALEAARATHGPLRVAVVDWDVHHGNGTEAVLLNNPNAVFFSIHQSSLARIEFLQDLAAHTILTMKNFPASAALQKAQLE